MSDAFAPWQQRAYDGALATFADGRLGHALLVSGPALLGQRGERALLGNELPIACEAVHEAVRRIETEPVERADAQSRQRIGIGGERPVGGREVRLL